MTKIDFYVDGSGRCRTALPWQGRAVRRRIKEHATAARACLARAALPEGASDNIIVAPARPLRGYREVTSVISDSGEVESVPEVYRAGSPACELDVFDRMAMQSKRRGGQVVFTKRQVELARQYRTLYERVDSVGFRSGLNPDAGCSGGDGTGFIEAYLLDVQVLRRLQEAIGNGVAKAVAGQVRTSGGGRVRVSDFDLSKTGRKIITVRRLVDDVCVAQKTLSACLEGAGWKTSTKNRKTLRAALCAALDRMEGIWAPS